MMLQPDEFAIPKLLKPVGYMLGHDVCVDVYFHFIVVGRWEIFQ
jgi:hypothetical protein